MNIIIKCTGLVLKDYWNIITNIIKDAIPVALLICAGIAPYIFIAFNYPVRYYDGVGGVGLVGDTIMLILYVAIAQLCLFFFVQHIKAKCEYIKAQRLPV